MEICHQITRRIAISFVISFVTSVAIKCLIFVTEFLLLA